MSAKISVYRKRCMSLLCFCCCFCFCFVLYFFHCFLPHVLLNHYLRLTIRLRQILGAPRECSENYPKVRTLFVPSFIQVQTKTKAQTRTEGQTAAQCGSPQFFSLFSSHSLSVRRKRTPTRDLS